MKRVFLIADDSEAAEAVLDELRVLGIDEGDVHVLARDDVPLKDIPEAEIMDRTDLVPGLKRGLAAGGAAGLVAGVTAVTFPPAGITVGGGALLASVAAGAGIGGWVAALVGTSSPNSEIERFSEAVREGRLLLLVDVPRERVGEVRALVAARHGGAEFAGESRALPGLE